MSKDLSSTNNSIQIFGKMDCLSCKRFHKCSRSKKGAGYICDHYKISVVNLDDYGFKRTSNLVDPILGDSDAYEERETKLIDLLDNQLNANSLVPLDIKIDDSDFKEYPSFYHWVTDPNGSGPDISPYSRQLVAALLLCGEICPRCSNKKALSVDTVPRGASPDTIFEKASILEFGICPRCKSTKSEMYLAGDLNFYVELDACIGQRAGKSALISLIAPYVIHKYLKMQNPTVALGLLPNSLLSATLVAMTYQKSVDLLWSPIHKLIYNSPWFSSYHAMLEDRGDKYGEELFQFKDTYLKYRHRNLFIYPSGPNKRTLRGDNRFLSCFAPDTLIHTTKGKLPIYRDLRGYIAVVGKNKYKITSWWAVKKVDSLLRIQIKNKFIDVTVDHKFPVLRDNMISLYASSDLVVGDVLATPYSSKKSLELGKDFNWKPILSITQIQRECTVYDLTVDSEDHLVVANGILTSNCIDELGWFDNAEGSSKKERASATEVYSALDNSLKTIRQKTLKILKSGFSNIISGLGINISSPSSINDKIMELVKTHTGSKDVLTIHQATWVFSPEYEKSDFSKNYRDNEIIADRDFGASPPMSDSPYLYNTDTLINLFGRKSNQVRYKYVVRSNKDETKTYKWAVIEAFKNVDCPPSILAIDNGYSDNSFALALGYLDKSGIMKVTNLIEIAPDKNRSVLNYNKIYNHIIKPLIEKRNVKAVITDRWQNLKILHDIEADFDIVVLQHSLKYDDFIDIRSYIQDEEKTIDFPAPEVPINDIFDLGIESYPHGFKDKPVAHLYFQLLTVRDLGNKIDKGTKLTDDVFRATILLLVKMLDQEWYDLHIKSADTKRGDKKFVGMLSNGQAFIRSTNMGASSSRGQTSTPANSIYSPKR